MTAVDVTFLQRRLAELEEEIRDKEDLLDSYAFDMRALENSDAAGLAGVAQALDNLWGGSGWRRSADEPWATLAALL